MQVAKRAEFLGSGLLQHDCKVGTEQFVGVFAQNRPEVRMCLTAFRGTSGTGIRSLVPGLGRALGLSKSEIWRRSVTS